MMLVTLFLNDKTSNIILFRKESFSLNNTVHNNHTVRPTRYSETGIFKLRCFSILLLLISFLFHFLVAQT